MFTALYRVYRPQKFSEVAGQNSAVEVLERELVSGRTAHAYLFSGARGCGKTSVARLMAKALNCENPADGYEPCCVCPSCVSITNGENLDVIEIDGASNNGVEEIRELKTHVALAPFNSRRKIYIIDEVHMLSTAAFNALLKTLEEPPNYVVFILATTEPHKVPVTIRSRCQHIPFHRIRPQDISERLKTVCNAEKLEYEEEALWEIARQSDGALRDALSLLDQVASLGKGKIVIDDVAALMGGGSLPALERWLSEWRNGSENSFTMLDDMFRAGASPQRTLEELFSLARNLWVVSNWGAKSAGSLDVSSAEREYLEKEALEWNPKALERFMVFLSKLIPSARVGMRTDVLVGIIVARRDEILNGEAQTQPERIIAAPAIRIAATPHVASAPEKKTSPPNPLPINGEGERAAISPPSPFMGREGPGVGEVLELDALNLREQNFPAFCALIGAKITESSEGDKIFCISVDSPYIFNILSGGKISAGVAAALRENFPACKVFVKFGEQAHECSQAHFPVKNAKYPPQISTIETPASKEKAPPENGGEKSAATAAVQNALKFMRGDVLVHRIQKDPHEDAANESEEEA